MLTRKCSQRLLDPPALVIFYQAMQHNIPEDLNIQEHCSENLKRCRKASCFAESLVTAI